LELCKKIQGWSGFELMNLKGRILKIAGCVSFKDKEAEIIINNESNNDLILLTTLI